MSGVFWESGRGRGSCVSALFFCRVFVFQGRKRVKREGGVSFFVVIVVCVCILSLFCLFVCGVCVCVVCLWGSRHI